jgi:hypothetical protein
MNSVAPGVRIAALRTADIESNSVDIANASRSARAACQRVKDSMLEGRRYPYKSARAWAWRNLMVFAINTGRVLGSASRLAKTALSAVKIEPVGCCDRGKFII